MRIRVLVTILAALLLVLPCFAPPKGGGFGGGRGGGGFGGGRSSGGGFGGGYSPRSSSPSYSPRGGGGSPVIVVPGGGGYYGPGFGPRYGYSAGFTSWIWILGAGGIAFLVFMMIAASSRSRSGVAAGVFTHDLVGAVLRLRNGRYYTRKLSELIEAADFAEPETRARVAETIAETLFPDDIVRAYLETWRASRPAETLAEYGERLTQRAWDQMDVDASVVNVATDGKAVEYKGKAQDVEEDSEGESLLFLLMTVPSGYLRNLRDGDRSEVLRFLEMVKKNPPEGSGALYVWFVPDGGASMKPEESERLYTKAVNTLKMGVGRE